MNDDALFPAEPYRVAMPVDPYTHMTPGARRRARQAQAMAVHGIHPLANIAPGLRLYPDVLATGRTCGTCVHRMQVQIPRVDHPSHSRHPKCTYGWEPESGTPAYTAPLVTRSAASDCKASWPGCERHETEADILRRDGGPEEQRLADELDGGAP